MSGIITALIALPILIASILVPWLLPLFVVLAGAAMTLGLYEFYVLAGKQGAKANAAAGYLAGAALFTIFYFASPSPVQTRLDLPTIVLVVILLTIGLWLRRRSKARLSTS